MITIRHVSKAFGDSILFQNVNLNIENGESVVIIGDSGCGKSTLLRCINKLETPDSGEILIDGKDILAQGADVDVIRKEMGMVYQNFALFSHMSVLENIILAPMRVTKLSRADAINQAKDILKKVGMSGKEDARPGTLSGGQKQRVAIARALAMHPSVMLFDEPTSALDPTMTEEVESVIKSLINDGITCVTVTHDLGFARHIASKVVFLADHGIYEVGTPEQILVHPQKALTQRFIYRSRMFETEISGDSLDLYSLSSEIKAFLRKRETNPKQERLLSVLNDELLYPLFEAEKSPARKAEIRLMCSETSSSHTMTIVFHGLSGDPLSEPYLDDLNRVILEKSFKTILSKQNGSEWNVIIQF